MISVAIMGKDEADNIGRCLDSIPDIVDEVVYVDTGSTDGTMEVVMSYADKLPLRVFEHQWQDSFSEARNYSFQQCSGDWIAYIDCDEEFSAGADRAIEYVVEHLSHCSAVVARIINERSSGVGMHYAARMFKNGKVTFQKRKHNDPVIDGEVAFVPQLQYYHWGYNLSKERMAQKAARDRKLLEMEIADNPASIYSRRHLIRTLVAMTDWAGIIEQVEALFRVAKESDISITPNTFQIVSYDLMTAYMGLKRWDDAIVVGETILDDWRNLDVMFTLGLAYMEVERYGDAIGMYEKFMVTLTEMKRDPKPDTVPVESWGAEGMALSNMGYAYEQMGHNKRAAKIYSDALSYDPLDATIRNNYEDGLANIAGIAPLKVLFLQNVTSTRNRKLATCLRAKGHHVDLGYTGINRFPDGVYDSHSKIDNIQDLVALSKNGYDIIYAMDSIGELALWCEEYIRNIPIIRDIHDLYELKPASSAVPLVSAVSLRHADGVTFSTPHQLEAAMRMHGWDGNNSLVMLNYATRSDTPEKFLPKLWNEDHELHLVYEGYVGLESHIDFRDFLSELMALGKNIHVHIYPVNDISDFAHQYMDIDSGYIHIHKTLPFDKLLEAMTQYDAGLIPWNLKKGSKAYIDTTIANKVFDYVLAGLPVVSVKSAALEWYIEDRGIGIVYETADDIASNIDKLHLLDMAGIAQKADYMEDRIDKLIGFFRLIKWGFHRPYTPPINITNGDIVRFEADNMDKVWDAYFSENGTARGTKERINWIVEQASGRVLDIGCADGLLPILYARKGLDSVGMDISKSHIVNAKLNLMREADEVKRRVKFMTGQGEKTSFDDGEFDTVSLGQILEHVINPERLLDEATRVLKPGGTLIASVPMGSLGDPKHLRWFDKRSFVTLLDQYVKIHQCELIGPRLCAVGSKEV